MWKKFDEDFRQMSCMSNNIMLENKEQASEQEGEKNQEEQKSLSKWENSWMFPRRWMLPSLRSELGTLDLFKGKDSEVIRMKEDQEKMEVSLDTAQYRPDELEINVEEGKLVIAGSHKETKGGGGGQRAVSQLKRRYVQLHNCTNNVQVEDV